MRIVHSNEGPMPGDLVDLLNGKLVKVSDEKTPLWDPKYWVYMIVDENGDTRYVRRYKKRDSGKTKGWIETDVHGLKGGPSEPRQLGFRLNPRRSMKTRERIDVPIEPDDEDIMISDNQREAYYIGKLIAEAETWDELMEAISRWMDANKYWPNVWYADDHGGWHDVSMEVPRTRKMVASGASRSNPRRRSAIQEILSEVIEYGGEYRTRGSVMAEMQRQGHPQRGIDAYMMGAKTVAPSLAALALEYPVEEKAFRREFRHLPEQPIDDPQMPSVRRRNFRGNPIVHGRLRRPITDNDARVVARRLKLRNVSMVEFKRGLDEELEHRDVTGGRSLTTGRIAAAHLREDPRYYTKLGRALKGRG